MFSSSRWNKASSDLNSHVVRAKAKKSAAGSPAAPPQPSIFSRLSTRMFGGKPGEAAEASAPASESKRAFGFATKNLALYDDKNSEDLYRYKNLSSSYMRSSSPPRDDADRGATASKKSDSDNDDDEQQDSSPKTRRPVKK